MAGVPTKVPSGEVAPTAAEMYPPKCSTEFWNMLLAIASPERDRDGRMVLKRVLTEPERRALLDRRAQLAPYVLSNNPGNRTRIKKAVSRMLVGGWDRAEGPEEAAARLATYVATLTSLPAWCVEQACQEFGAGTVQPHEVGVAKIDRTYPPAAAMVAEVARRRLKPFGDEFTKIGLALQGVAPARKPTDAERESVLGKMRDLREHLASRNAPTPIEIEAEAVRAEARRRQTAEMIRREYRERGLDPPAGDDIVSLSVMLQQGWTIEEVDGRCVLVDTGSRPKARAPR